MSGNPFAAPHFCFTVADDVLCFECRREVGHDAYRGDADDLSQNPLVNERESFDADAYYDGDVA